VRAVAFLPMARPNPSSRAISMAKKMRTVPDIILRSASSFTPTVRDRPVNQPKGIGSAFGAEGRRQGRGRRTRKHPNNGGERDGAPAGRVDVFDKKAS